MLNMAFLFFVSKLQFTWELVCVCVCVIQIASVLWKELQLLAKVQVDTEVLVFLHMGIH
jgi:hypothetical protein